MADTLELCEELVGERLVMKAIQTHFFASEILDLRNRKSIQKSSKLKSLLPFLDEDEFLRLGGRLQ